MFQPLNVVMTSEFKNDFQNYVKSNLDSNTLSPPLFNTSFMSYFAQNIRLILSLPQPSVPYNISPPAYQQTTKVVRRMRSSGSPCTLDKISVVPFKRCPYSQGYIIEVICALEIWWDCLWLETGLHSPRTFIRYISDAKFTQFDFHTNSLNINMRIKYYLITSRDDVLGLTW